MPPEDSNVASTTDTQAAAPAKADPPAKSELKSTDTGVISAIKARAETATPPKAPTPKEKPADATPAGKGADADSSEAEHQDDDRKIEPWMRKRLQRAEEKGRKLGRTDILDEIRTLRPAPAAAPAKAEVKPEQTQQPAAPKTLADFDYDLEKFTQHQIREGVKTALTERDAEQDKARKERTAEEARTAFEKRKAEFESRAGEGTWDEMVSAKVDVPQEVIDLLMGHDKDLDIAHYLIQHPTEIDKLRGKSKLEIARGLATVETKLSGSAQEELPPRTTKTPPPPPTISGYGKSSKSIADMSTAERIATWKAQKASRRTSA